MINKKLAKDRNIPDKTINEIELYHELRDFIHKRMGKTKSRKNLQTYNKSLDIIEEILQELWGFDRNINYIKFWERPKCSCPHLDNNDRYPYGYYIINNDCVLHGENNGLYKDNGIRKIS